MRNLQCVCLILIVHSAHRVSPVVEIPLLNPLEVVSEQYVIILKYINKKLAVCVFTDFFWILQRNEDKP